MMRRSFLAGLSIVLAIPALAQDEGIYGASVPADYTYVRLVDRDGANQGSGTIAGARLDIGQSASSPYQALPPGPTTLDVNGQSWPVDLPAASIVSVAYGKSGNPLVIVDDIGDDPAKATIALYNFTNDPVGMTTFVKKDVDIFKDIPASSAVFRAINSATIPVTISNANGGIAEFTDQALQRRTIISYFVFTGSDGPFVTTQVERTRD